MIIGVDFDNTIICYDDLFHGAALSEGLISKSLNIQPDKQSIKQYLISKDRENDWTFLQGVVYGVWIKKANAFPFAVDAIASLLESGHTICVISHKTRLPYLGPQNDLHLAANNWLEENVVCKLGKGLESNFSVSFNETIDQKIKKIRTRKCDAFIDDLEQILLHKNFPMKTKRFLFSPHGHSLPIQNQKLSVMRSWSEFESLIDV